jgi:hypothetical protein
VRVATRRNGYHRDGSFYPMNHVPDRSQTCGRGRTPEPGRFERRDIVVIDNVPCHKVLGVDDGGVDHGFFGVMGELGWTEGKDFRTARNRKCGRATTRRPGTTLAKTRVKPMRTRSAVLGLAALLVAPALAADNVEKNRRLEATTRR